MEQGTNYLPHIIIGFIALIIGWAMGYFDSNLRSSKKIKQAEESAAIAAQEAKNKIAEFEARAASMTATPVALEDPGLMRIKNENGTLTLDLDGERVNTFALHPDHRKRLIEMLNVIRPWLEHKPVTAPPPPSLSSFKATPAADTRQGASINIASPVSQSVSQVASPQPLNPAPAPKKDDKPATAPTSMVGQINAILQLRIANTKLATQGVTMIESPSGGVFVYVGLNKFEGVDAVPDEDIKAAIRAAIAEWERKYTPGLG